MPFIYLPSNSLLPCLNCMTSSSSKSVACQGKTKQILAIVVYRSNQSIISQRPTIFCKIGERSTNPRLMSVSMMQFTSLNQENIYTAYGSSLRRPVTRPNLRCVKLCLSSIIYLQSNCDHCSCTIYCHYTLQPYSSS